MIRLTLIGGAIFLIPVVFLIYILAKAFEMSSRVVEGIARVSPVHGIASDILADVLAVLLILGVCFLAGLAAKRAFFARHVQRIEHLLADFFPGFTIAKSMVTGIAGAAGVDERTKLLRSVLVAFDDYEAVGFEVERSETRVIVFLPGAPSAWSGQSVVVSPDRVTDLNLPVHQVAKLMRTLGRGTNAALDDARQTPARVAPRLPEPSPDTAV